MGLAKSLGVLSLLLIALPVAAQPERYPTEVEFEGLVEQFRLELPRLLETGFYTDRRSLTAQQERTDWVAAWAAVDAAIAPFLGQWYAIEEDIAIFPTPNRGEVCVVDTYLDDSDFYRGTIIDGRLYANNQLVFMPEGQYLLSTFVYDGEAGYYPYANPVIPENPASLEYFAQQHPEVVAAFQAAGCLTGLPDERALP